jgi:hypothetical protein
VERLEKDLLRVLGPFTDDGYSLARELEDDYVMDITTANVLDAVQVLTYGAVQASIKDWVKTHAITAPYPKGTRVKFRYYVTDHEKTGVIDHSSIYDYDCEALSPIQLDAGYSTRHCVVAWEKLELIEE